MVRKPLIYDQFGKYLLSVHNMHPAYYLHIYVDEFHQDSIPQIQLFSKI